jgi:hypothetical protein
MRHHGDFIVAVRKTGVQPAAMAGHGVKSRAQACHGKYNVKTRPTA